MEASNAVHRPRFCMVFAPDGIFKIPTATLLRENHGRWRPFYISTGPNRNQKDDPKVKNTYGSSRLQNICRIYPISYFSFFRREVMLTRSLMSLCRSSIFTLSWVMVSRSRTVTQWSLRESWSTVTQNGVPMAS